MIWIVVLGAALVAVYLFRTRKASRSHSLMDEANGWLRERGLDPATARFNVHHGSRTRHSGATTIVGLADGADGEIARFVIEVLSGGGVVCGEILKHRATVMRDNSLALELKLAGSSTPLIDGLLNLDELASAAKSESKRDELADVELPSGAATKKPEKPRAAAPLRRATLTILGKSEPVGVLEETDEYIVVLAEDDGERMRFTKEDMAAGKVRIDAMGHEK